jgi:predicted Zn-dependent protease
VSRVKRSTDGRPRSPKGEFDEAELMLERLGANVPGHPNVAFFSALLASARGDYEEAESSIRASSELSRGAPFVRMQSTLFLFGLETVRGRLRHRRLRALPEHADDLPPARRYDHPAHGVRAARGPPRAARRA